MTPFMPFTFCSACTVPIAAGGCGVPGGPGGGGTSMSTVPLNERAVILSTADFPPSASSYLAKTSATDGSGAAAGFGATGGAAGAGPLTIVAGALLGDMFASILE